MQNVESDEDDDCAGGFLGNDGPQQIGADDG